MSVLPALMAVLAVQTAPAPPPPCAGESDWAERGRYKSTVVPSPTLLDSASKPCDWVAKAYACGSPRPVPSPGALVVKKGSSACASTSGGMPLPVSATVTIT